MKPTKHKIIAIVGPTATGKSDLGVFLARKFGGEVVSADSRQVYRGLDIGSGKITNKEMKGVPHHMLDVADPKRRYTVAQYVKEGTRAIEDIIARGKVPIVVGGTGLYVDSLVYGATFPEVPPNPKLRSKLETKTPEQLFAMLKKKDPERAKSIDQHNRVRLVRALEIVDALGKVPPAAHEDKRYDTLYVGLTLPPEKLAKKVRARLHIRMKEGMVKEVKRLHERGVSWKRLDELGLEYRFVSRYLRKLISKENLLAVLETEILQFARRQRTWFRRHDDILWFEPGERKAIVEVVSAFLKGT